MSAKYIRRKKAKEITEKEFTDSQRYSFDLEEVLCKDYVYILDAMDMEGYDYDDTSTDIFKELVYENKVVGYVTYLITEYGLELIETYVMKEFRGKNIFDELKYQLDKGNKVTIHNPKIALVKSLIKCNLASKISDNIVISQIFFEADRYQLKHKVDSADTFLSFIYDLEKGSVLLMDDDYPLNCTRPNRTDKEKFNLKDDITDKYLEKVHDFLLKTLDETRIHKLDTPALESPFKILII